MAVLGALTWTEVQRQVVGRFSRLEGRGCGLKYILMACDGIGDVAGGHSPPKFREQRSCVPFFQMCPLIPSA